MLKDSNFTKKYALSWMLLLYFLEIFRRDISQNLRRVIFYRSIRLLISAKLTLLKISKNSHGVSWLEAYNFIKKRLQHRYFPVNSTKVSRTPFYRTIPDDWFYSEKSHFYYDYFTILVSTEEHPAFV